MISSSKARAPSLVNVEFSKLFAALSVIFMIICFTCSVFSSVEPVLSVSVPLMYVELELTFTAAKRRGEKKMKLETLLKLNSCDFLHAYVYNI